MESGQQLSPQSSATHSLQMASSSASSPPAPAPTPPAKCSPASSRASSSPLAKNGQMPRMSINEHFNTSGSFPLMNHPDLGLYTSTSGHSEFGGLGSLGLSSMAAFSQFGTFPVSHFAPDWCRTPEAPTRGVFFPPLLGLHPAFASTFKSLDPIHLQAFSSVSVGVKGTVNGRGPSSPAGKCTVSTSSFPVKEQRGTNTTNGSGRQKARQDPGQLHQKTVQQPQEKKPNKRSLETLNMGGNHSGSVSGSSSDGEEISSDPDDMEEEDNDEDNQSNDSEDSDSEKEGPVKVKVKRLTHNTSESKKRRPSTAVDSHCDSVPLTSSFNLQFASRHAGGDLSTEPLPGSKTAEDKRQQHISVIQTTGLAGGNNTLARCHRKSLPLLFKTPPNSVSFSTSHKHLPPSTSPKRSSHSSSPKHSFVSSSPKPLDLCSPSKFLPLSSSPKPSSLCSSTTPALSSLPKPPTSMVSRKPTRKSKFPMATQPADSVKESSGDLPDGSPLKMKTLKLKKLAHSKDSFEQAFAVRPTSQNCNDTNQFFSQHPNGVINSKAQDAPLALITKPHHLSSLSSRKLILAPSSPYPVPINLSTGKKEPSGPAASPHKPSASLGLAHRPGKTTTVASLHAGKSQPTNSLSCLGRGCESDIHSSKDSDDSLDDFDDDDDDDGIEDEDSGSSLSESESNLESDSGGSEDDIKANNHSNATRAPLKSVASLSPPKSTSTLSTSSPLLNPPVIKPSVSLHTPTTLTSSGPLSNHSTPSPSFATLSGSGKRRRVTDESVLQLPLKFGWQRETRIRAVAGRLQGEVAYFAPCGKKLRQYPDVIKYLVRNGITKISRDNFSFSSKMKVGDFYEAREGPEGLQWFLLAEDEIASSIVAMDGRHHRRPKSDPEPAGEAIRAREMKDHLKLNINKNNFQNVRDVKLLRKLEAQEIARQAAQIKLMRKLEKQAMLQAAKEAKKQQVIMAAEERRKKREQLKSIKQQEKIKRIQQVRMEKERRAQQILESKRKKKEAAANAKILEAEKRNKEKEIRRLQAVILKHQELERHRLDMERERRRQHMMLMKAVEARKKAEEKERVKKEKKDEKRLNKERKLELRRLELEKVKELKKPNEDMCLADQKPMPELSRVPGLVLSGSTFSDCLVVLQFLCSFGKVLGLDRGSGMIHLWDLQVGLLNIGGSRDKVQDLLVSMLSAAVRDPGLPAGHKSKTILGDHLTNVEINRDNVSEILQKYMEGHCEQTELAALTLSLRTKPFQAHSPSQKASILAFLVNELCSSKAVISEIDKNIDHMTNLKKDMSAVEGKLRKLRNIHAKRTGKRDVGVGGEDRTLVMPTVTSKCKRKEGDSEEEEDEDDDTEDQGDDDDEEEEESGGRKGKKTDICEEEDDGVHSISVEELEKQIEKTYKQQNHIRQKLFESSVSLRSMTIGQDRYKRRYWLLPQCGGVFVEGMESGEGWEEVEREKKRQRAAQDFSVKEEQNPAGSSTPQSPVGHPAASGQQDSLNLFLQKPGSLSNLSKLLEEAKTTQDANTDMNSHKVSASASYPLYPCSQGGLTHSPPSVTYQQVISANKTDTPVPSLLRAPQLKGSPWLTCSPQRVPHDDQLTKILNSQWFSLLPRSPCDEASLTSSCTSVSSSPHISTKPLSSPSPTSVATTNYSASAGINNLPSPVIQQVKSGIHQRSLTLCDEPSTASSLSLSFPGMSPHPMLDLVSQHTEGSGNKVPLLANNSAVIKHETTKVSSDTPLCASVSNVEVAKTQDYPSPQPIPEEMLHGWWRISDMEELHSVATALHSRGIREKVLQKQIQKHMEDMNQLYANSKDVGDMAEKQEVSKRIVENWCIEDQAMEVDIGLLRQVEDLERKVVSASLQIKGWMHPEPMSEREDLVYHEHKLFSSLAPHNKGCGETSSEEPVGPVVRWPNNPLDIAVSRLMELERNIERSEEEAAPGLRVWRKAVSEVRSSAQLSLCIQKLQKSISWERSLMKVHCQICGKGDNEELLLLCDGCDKGCHTYCHKPKITTVPEGDWFCPSCVAKESGQKHQIQAAAWGKRSGEAKRSVRPPAVGEHTREEAASSHGVSKKAPKEVRKRKGDEVPPGPQAKHESPVPCAKKAKTARGSSNGLATCRALLAELEAHQDAWPFLTPVDHKAVPGYRKVIRRPMDFSTIREKLTSNQYVNLEAFIVDVNLVFDNCEKFNEDNSEIGRAGHNMRRFFDERWTDLLK
ncbi:bromodomain adjacent to zinc finger domain protein 2B isoform X2 [Betta splendens]|uniref:Bromodomain adjacent to zinc finger domain protein 2B isoform X2 n=1 Tax=Betta splendens TaxID=158456 RepID=A0A6P7LAK7_BETSP|nr:bromodomain adjacent to zinc finger domain protein 2B isoform X2 [Betta splendens]